jgi:uncharacterized protein (DUF1330 family)
MPAYVFADTVSVHDTKLMDAYRGKVGPTIARHGGKFVVRGGKHEVKEGTWQPTRLAIIEFPSRAAAEAWYSDLEYVPLTKMRQSAGKGHLLIVDGV